MKNILTKEDISEILLNVGAVNISIENPFRYASGLISPIYTNCRVLSSYTKERKAIIDEMIKHINGLENGIDIVASAGVSSTVLTSLFAQRLKIPMVYVRSKPKTHGKKKEIEGIFKAGDRVLLVSDIISTEKDIPNSVKAIEKNGGEVVHCLALFSNNIGTIENFLKEVNIPYTVLTDLTTLLKKAYKKKVISLEEKEEVEKWAKSPEKWDEERFLRMKEIVEKNKRSVAEILLEIGAVTINTKQPFKYTSGILSPIYTDNRLLISYPEKWGIIIDSFVTGIINIIGMKNIDVIAGTATSGIPHAALIAERLNLPLIYVKFGHNDEVEYSSIEGKIKEGQRILMIEDHITTGKSVLSSAKVLRESGAIVDWCVSIFTYGTEKAKKTFNDQKINLLTLCDLSSLMDIAIEKKYITDKDQEIVLSWLKDPEKWKLSG